jgi:molybdopterin-containing oxidoreductase family iron-sulfur binding subunit
MTKRKSSSQSAEQNADRPALDRKIPLNRRDVLKIGGATLAVAAVSQAVVSGPFSAESVQGINREDNGHSEGTHQWHMAIDLSLCIGCHYCVRTCQAVNDVPDDEMQWNIVFPEQTEVGVEFYMNRPCQHCQDAPCTHVCPVGATWVRADGIVAMDYDRCIGCRYCQVACPYDVRRFNWRTSKNENSYVPEWGTPEVDRRPRGVVEKCSFCVQRIDRGLSQGLTPGVDRAATPACVVACPVNARIFGDILDPESPVTRYLNEHESFRLHEEWGTEPKVHYISPGNERS